MSKKMITVREATKFLQLNEKIMKDMTESGIFKTVKSGKTLKIDKAEIEEWLANLSDKDEERLALSRTRCRFQDYFKDSYIKKDFDADNKYDAIGEMCQFAKNLKLVRDHRWLYEVVLAREELISTAVGKGVAFLHPRHMHPTKVKIPSILYGTSKNLIDFDAPDKKPVKHFFMLLMHNDKQHLFSLSYLSRFIMNEENVINLNKLEDNDEIVDFVTNFE